VAQRIAGKTESLKVRAVIEQIDAELGTCLVVKSIKLKAKVF